MRGRALIIFSLVLAATVSLAHPTAVVPVDQEISLADVLGVVNPAFPGLQAFSAAMQANDLPRAQVLLVEHFATRTKPAIPAAKAPGIGEGNSTCVLGKASADQADQWLKHVFSLRNNDVGKVETFELGPEIKWMDNPSEALSWILYLNQLNHLNSLAGLYRETNDEKLAAEVGQSVLRWSKQVPRWYGYTNQGSLTPSGMEVRNRLCNLLAAYDVLRASPSLTPEMHLAFWKVFIASARELQTYSGVSYPGLIPLAVMFPEFTEAAAWMKSGEQNLRFCLINRTSPEGAWDTQSISYQTVPVPWALRSLEFLQANPESGDFGEMAAMVKAQTGKLLELMLRIAMPNGGLPNVGDTYGRPDWGPGTARPMLTSFIHSQMTPEQQEKLNAIPDHFERLKAVLAMLDGAAGPAPSQASQAFPGSGYYVMRSGWEPEQARYLYLDLTPQAMGHAHNDAGHFDLYAYGKPLLADTGDYFLGWGYRAALHNTIEVDGRDQARGPKAPMMPYEWLSTAAWDFADVAHGAYEDLGVTHRRKLLFVKPDYFILCDLLTGEGSHKLEQFFHFAGKTQSQASEATLDEKTLVAQSANPETANVRIIPVHTDGLQAAFVEAQETPMKPDDKYERAAMLGWMVTGGSFQRVKAPVVAYSREGELPQAFYDVLYPTPARATAEITVTTLPVYPVERDAQGRMAADRGKPLPPTQAAGLVVSGKVTRPRYRPDEVKLHLPDNLALSKPSTAEVNQGEIAAQPTVLTDGQLNEQSMGGAVASAPFTPNVLLTGRFSVDLGAETEINCVILHHGTWNGSTILYPAEKMTLQYWAGDGWRDVPGQETSWPGQYVSQTSFPPLRASRLSVAVERPSGGRIALREFEVYRVPEAELQRVAAMRAEMIRESFTDTVLISHTGKGFRQYGDYLFDGEMALIRADGNGVVRQVSVKDATELLDGDRRSLHLASPPDSAVAGIIDPKVQLEPAQPGFTGAQPSALVSWKTPVPATSQVFYGDDGKFAQRTPLDPRLTTEHAVRVFFLRPDRTYTFRAVSATRHGWMQAELTGEETHP